MIVIKLEVKWMIELKSNIQKIAWIYSSDSIMLLNVCQGIIALYILVIVQIVDLVDNTNPHFQNLGVR